MKQLEKILDKVKEIKNMQKNSYSDKYILDATIELEKIVQEEYFKAFAKETKTSKQFSSATRLLKQAGKKRPILGNTNIDNNDYQVFTNSYILFKMKKHIPNLPINNEDINGKYPNTERIVPTENLLKQDFKVEDIKKFMVENEINSNEKIFTLDLNNDTKVGFSRKNFLHIIDILDFKNKDTITLQYISNIKPFVIYNDNEDLGLILPVRLN